MKLSFRCSSWFFVLAIVLSVPKIGTSQSINDIFHLDTIIPIHDYFIKNNDLNPRVNTILSSNNLYYLIHKFNRLRMDSICFTFIDKKTKKQQSFNSAVGIDKGEVRKIEPRAMTANSDYIFLIYPNRLIVYKIINEKDSLQGVVFYNAIRIPEFYDFISVNESNELICSNIYDKRGLKDEHISIIDIFHYDEGQLHKVLSFYPDFSGVEFSHFLPQHWVSVSSKNIAVSQTTRYEIGIYDKKGNELYSIQIKKPEWIQMQKDVLSRLRRELPVNNSRILIDSLKPYNDKKISRIEGIWFLNNDSLLVSYFNYDFSKNMKLRYFDLYKVEKKSAKILFSSLIDGNFPIEINKIVTKSNFDILTWNYESEISDNEIYLIRNYAPIFPYTGKKWSVLKNEEEEYYKNNKPVLSLFVFKLK